MLTDAPMLPLQDNGDVDVDVDDSCLFLNLDTGRFLRKRLPVLRNYAYKAMANGLFLLQDLSDYFRRLCVLNPFTGSLVRFRLSYLYDFDRSSVGVAGRSAMVLFNFFDTTHLAWADQTCTLCPPVSTPTQDLDRFTAVIGFQGRAYVANWTGSVAVVEISQQCKKREITVVIAGNRETQSTFLVDNAGELLLVRVPLNTPMEVFRVDLVRKVLVPVRSIGTRALFLGIHCSLSVKADRLPGIDANCIYYGLGFLCEPGVRRNHLGDDRGMRHTDERLILHTGHLLNPIVQGASRPMTLAYVLVCYCMGYGC